MKRKLLIKEIKERRCREILDMATEVFAKTGYHLTDVDVIAGKLKIGKGTIYRYFPTKHKLFTAVVEQMMQSYAAEMRGGFVRNADPVETLKSIIHSHIHFFENHFDIMEIFIHYRSEYKEESKDLYVKHYAKDLRRLKRPSRNASSRGSSRTFPPRP